MSECSKGDHDDCKHVLLDAIKKVGATGKLTWAQDHVTIEGEWDWTPSKHVLTGWVDVRLLGLEDVDWNWHLTVESERDADDDRSDEDRWDVLVRPYNVEIDVVMLDGELDPWKNYVRPPGTDMTSDDQIADDLMEANVHPEAIKAIYTRGGWTDGYLSMELSEWIYNETHQSLMLEYDNDAEPSPMHEQAREMAQAVYSGTEETYTIGVLDNGVEVRVPGPVFEQLRNMPEDAVAEIIKQMNEGPGQLPRNDGD